MTPLSTNCPNAFSFAPGLTFLLVLLTTLFILLQEVLPFFIRHSNLGWEIEC